MSCKLIPYPSSIYLAITEAYVEVKERHIYEARQLQLIINIGRKFA